MRVPTAIDVLFRLLIQGHTKADIETIFDNLMVVCFNYDRCIEHFLFEALRIHNGDQVDLTAVVKGHGAVEDTSPVWNDWLIALAECQ